MKKTDKLALRLINRILKSKKELTSVLSQNFSPGHLGIKWAGIAMFIMTHFGKHGKLPTLDLVKAKFEHYEDIKAKNAATYYWEEILNARKITQLGNLMTEMEDVEITGDNVDTVIEEVMENLHTIKNRFANDMSLPETFTKLFPKTMDIYRKKSNKEIVGLPIPFEVLRANLRSWGLNKLQVVVARAGAGKTWFACINGVAVAEQGKKLLLISMEMQKEELARRILAIGSGINFSKLSQGIAFDEDEQSKLTEFQRKLAATSFGKNITIVGPGTISKPAMLEPFIKLYQPDMVIIDSFYMQTDIPGRDPKEKIDNLLKEYRRIASTHPIHLMLTSQFNRSARGEKTSNEFAMAFSDHVNYVADIIIVLQQDNYLKEINQIHIGQGKVRDGKSHIVGRYNWDFDKMDFSCTDVVDMGDVTSTEDTSDM